METISVLATRCRKCNREEGPTVHIVGGKIGRICLDCYRIQRRNNHKRWRKIHHQHFSSLIRKCYQSTPQSFIKHLAREAKRRAAKARLRPDKPEPTVMCLLTSWAKRLAEQRTYQSWLRARYWITRRTTMAKCKKRGHKMKYEFSVTADYLISIWDKQNGKCALSGLSMAHKFNNPRSASLDRIDSAKGYIEGNIQLVCQWANFAKSSSSNAEFKKIIDAIRNQNVA